MKTKTKHYALIGREGERTAIEKALKLGRNLLIEGPVGVGKTFLVRQILDEKKVSYERVDGDTRYTEQKLTGWFDPPIVLKKGFVAESFIEGPLLSAMKAGRPLFINELNRMPEAVQNILLPAMDERQIILPKIGKIEAKRGFLVVATQNPREFTATHALSEALLDRFEMVHLTYQNREEELAILNNAAPTAGLPFDRIVDLIRATRNHASIKRGASIRAGLALVELMQGDLSFDEAVRMALPSRIEMVNSDEDPHEILGTLLGQETFDIQKKKLQTRS